MLKQLFLILALYTISINSQPNIDIFMESQDEKSFAFFEEQLKKLLSHPSKQYLYKTIDYIWYGNAEVVDIDIPSFKCEHGENECYGNMMFLCIPSKLIDVDEFIVNISNEVRKTLPKTNFNSSFYENIIGSDLYKKGIMTYIYNCVKKNGADKMLEAKEKTRKITNNLPFFTFDGYHNIEYDRKMKEDIIKFLCEFNGIEGKVQGC